MVTIPQSTTPPDEPVVAVPRRLLSAAYNALRSYEFGNSATDLAQEVAAQLEPYAHEQPGPATIAKTSDAMTKLAVPILERYDAGHTLSAGRQAVALLRAAVDDSEGGHCD